MYSIRERFPTEVLIFCFFFQTCWTGKLFHGVQNILNKLAALIWVYRDKLSFPNQNRVIEYMLVTVSLLQSLIQLNFRT